MAIYKSIYSGTEIDNGVEKAISADARSIQNANSINQIAGETATLQEAVEGVEGDISGMKTDLEDVNQKATVAQNTAITAKSTADTAKTTADAAKDLTEQNSARIQTIEDTAPQFSLEGTTLTITLPA